MTKRTVPLGPAGQRFEVRKQIDAEFVVEHLMRSALFYIRSGTPYARDAINRRVKDKLIKGAIGTGEP